MERQILGSTVTISFGVIAKGSNDEQAIKALAVLPDIWDEQCGDGESREQIVQGTFEGVTAAVFYDQSTPFGPTAFGYILFVPRPDGLYEQHTAFITSRRGPLALRCIKEAHKELFLTTPAIGLITLCPDWNPGSRSLSHKLGAVRVSAVPMFKIRGGRMLGATLYHLTLWTWSCENHDDFQDVGEAWHERVFAKMPAAEHDDDPAHNGWLGLALEMGKHQPQKGMDVYNSWAMKANYAPGQLLWSDSNGHSLIDFGHGVCLNSPDAVLAVIPKCPQLQPSPPLPPLALASPAR